MEFNNHTPSSRELIKRCISAKKQVLMETWDTKIADNKKIEAVNLIILNELKINIDF